MAQGKMPNYRPPHPDLSFMTDSKGFFEEAVEARAVRWSGHEATLAFGPNAHNATDVRRALPVSPPSAVA
ncbi:hypothetical protein GCM10009075_01630 [Sphingomonas trueperi]